MSARQDQRDVGEVAGDIDLVVEGENPVQVEERRASDVSMHGPRRESKIIGDVEYLDPPDFCDDQEEGEGLLESTISAFRRLSEASSVSLPNPSSAKETSAPEEIIDVRGRTRRANISLVHIDHHQVKMSAYVNAMDSSRYSRTSMELVQNFRITRMGMKECVMMELHIFLICVPVIIVLSCITCSLAYHFYDFGKRAVRLINIAHGADPEDMSTWTIPYIHEKQLEQEYATVPGMPWIPFYMINQYFLFFSIILLVLMTYAPLSCTPGDEDTEGKTDGVERVGRVFGSRTCCWFALFTCLTHSKIVGWVNPKASGALGLLIMVFNNIHMMITFRRAGIDSRPIFRIAVLGLVSVGTGVIQQRLLIPRVQDDSSFVIVWFLYVVLLEAIMIHMRRSFRLVNPNRCFVPYAPFAMTTCAMCMTMMKRVPLLLVQSRPMVIAVNCTACFIAIFMRSTAGPRDMFMEQYFWRESAEAVERVRMSPGYKNLGQQCELVMEAIEFATILPMGLAYLLIKFTCTGRAPDITTWTLNVILQHLCEFGSDTMSVYVGVMRYNKFYIVAKKQLLTRYGACLFMGGCIAVGHSLMANLFVGYFGVAAIDGTFVTFLGNSKTVVTGTGGVGAR